jgi:hypothetical protein
VHSTNNETPTGASLQGMTVLIYRTIKAVILNLRILPYQPFPYSPILPTPTETRKITKKPPFTVSRNILESKEVTFENRYKNYIFLSVFSVLSYIFDKTNV